MSKTSRTIADKRNELSELVAWFESDEFTPEEAVERFKTAEKLAKDIENDLLSRKNEITVLKESFESS